MSDSEIEDCILSESDVSGCSVESSDEDGMNNDGNSENEVEDNVTVEPDITDANPWFKISYAEPEREDPYDFLETVGPRNIPVETSTPEQYFRLFFTPNLIQIFVRETNKYAANFLSTTELKRRSLGHKWVPVTATEMKAFISIILNMGLVRKPTIKSYWSTSSSQRTPWFAQVMSRDRFELILKFFHMVDSSRLPKPGQDGYDPCARFDLLVQHANETSRQFYQPHREICIDESLIGTKCKTQLIQYLPNKHHHKWGIKLYMMCDSVSAYLLGFFVYKGKRDNVLTGRDDFDKGLAHKVVMRLLRMGSYLRRGYHLFVDNFFTSMPLVRELAEQRTHITGTVRRNRKEFPKGLKAKLQPEEIVTFRQGETLVTAYREKKSQKNSVLLLSTKNPAGTMDVLTRRRGVPQGGDGQVTVKKPLTVLEYNKYMGGVDQTDMMLYFYLDERRTIKYWKKVAFNILSRMLLNSYILYKENTTGRAMDRYKFNTLVVEALAKDQMNKDGVEAVTDAGVCPVPSNGEKDCSVCSNRKIPGGRKRSRTMCQRCQKGLHGPCFPKHRC